MCICSIDQTCLGTHRPQPRGLRLSSLRGHRRVIDTCRSGIILAPSTSARFNRIHWSLETFEVTLVILAPVQRQRGASAPLETQSSLPRFRPLSAIWCAAIPRRWEVSVGSGWWHWHHCEAQITLPYICPDRKLVSPNVRTRDANTELQDRSGSNFDN